MADHPPYYFAYVHTDIPEGMTIREWRTQRAAARVAAEPEARENCRRRRRPVIGRVLDLAALARPVARVWIRDRDTLDAT